jgi:hypothetical protein
MWGAWTKHQGSNNGQFSVPLPRLFRSNMDKRTRAYKIYKVGIDRQGENGGMSDYYLETIARMIDFATREKKAKKEGGVSGSASMRPLERLIPEFIEPCTAPPYARFGGILTKNKLTDTHVNRVARYLEAGNWYGNKPTLMTIVARFTDLLDKATAWEHKRDAPPNVEFV